MYTNFKIKTSKLNECFFFTPLRLHHTLEKCVLHLHEPKFREKNVMVITKICGYFLASSYRIIHCFFEKKVQILLKEEIWLPYTSAKTKSYKFGKAWPGQQLLLFPLSTYLGVFFFSKKKKKIKD